MEATPAQVAEQWRGLSVPEISNRLNTWPREMPMQLDFVARLVTELRTRKLWPPERTA